MIDFEKIKANTDIVDIVSRYIKLERHGTSHKAVCPFHDDTDPSLSVDTKKQIFKCFSCNAAGDVFAFVQKFEKIPWIDAVKKVAVMTNQITEDSLTPLNTPENTLYRLMQTVTEYYNYLLDSPDDNVKNYLELRRLDSNIINDFKVGYSNGETVEYLLNKGFELDEIIKSGIGIMDERGTIDRFASRLIFPIQNADGKVIALSGRRIIDNDTAKYINSPDTPIFNKGHVLYNYYNATVSAKIAKQVYVVEGYMDVISLYKAGIKNAVAIMGTALTLQQWRLLEALKVDVIFALDNDKPGQEAIFKLLSSKPLNLNIKVVKTYSEGKDFDEALNSYGKDRLKQIVSNVIPWHEFYYNFLKQHFNILELSQKAKFVEHLTKLINQENISELERNYFNDNIRIDTKITLSIEKSKNPKGKVVNDKNKLITFPEIEMKILQWIVSNPDYFTANKDGIPNFNDKYTKGVLGILTDMNTDHMPINRETVRTKIQESYGKDKTEFDIYAILLMRLDETPREVEAALEEHKVNIRKKLLLKEIQEVQGNNDMHPRDKTIRLAELKKLLEEEVKE